MWVWALRGSRHFEPMSYSVWPQLPHRGELIIVSLGGAIRLTWRTPDTSRWTAVPDSTDEKALLSASVANSHMT
jgi:hypothetical protein